MALTEMASRAGRRYYECTACYEIVVRDPGSHACPVDANGNTWTWYVEASPVEAGRSDRGVQCPACGQRQQWPGKAVKDHACEGGEWLLQLTTQMEAAIEIAREEGRTEARTWGVALSMERVSSMMRMEGLSHRDVDILRAVLKKLTELAAEEEARR